MIDWDEVYAHVITATGWTWEYLDEFVTLPRLNALNKHWGRFPPMHITAAAFAGIEMKTTTPDAEPAPIENADILRGVKADPRSLSWVQVS